MSARLMPVRDMPATIPEGADGVVETSRLPMLLTAVESAVLPCSVVGA